MSADREDTTTLSPRPIGRADGSVILDAAIGRRGVTEALFSGLSSPRWGWRLHEVAPLPRAFRMMINDRRFQVAEMALTTLAMAIEHGRPVVGLPVVLNRDFHYRSIVVAARSGIQTPEDLAGRRVGVRAYSQTTGVWVRGLLASTYGVEPESMEWVTLEGAHVPEFVDPPHVKLAAEGSTIPRMLANGELDAAVVMDPHFDLNIARPLFPDAHRLAAQGFAANGIYPVNHVVAVDTRLLAERPSIANELFVLFEASKQRYLERLRIDGPVDGADRHALQLANIVGSDFNPYGLEANRKSCELLISYSHQQGLLRRPVDLDGLFYPVTASTSLGSAKSGKDNAS